MLISKDGRRSLNACRPAEGDGFQIPSPDRACTRLEYQDSVRAAPPWSGATDADRHLEPASAGRSRAEFAAVRARIIAAADDARCRIARDLHDGPQQQLVCLGLRVRLAEESIPHGHEDLQCELARIAEGLREARNVREISRGLHPAILSQCGLGPAVKALACRSSVPVRLHAEINGRLPDPVETGAYYIVSEALANAAKHANASVVDISIKHRGQFLTLAARDDGVGGADHNGPGLAGLTDRIDALAGTMQLLSPPGRGTHLFVNLPTGTAPTVAARGRGRPQEKDHPALARPGLPGESAPAICFLLSDDASYITGAHLAVDGGWLA
jgi:signal transduction histidine kinase